MSAGSQTEVSIPAGPVELEGNLTIPEGAHAIVIFAHGSGSSRFSARNRLVARLLNDARLGTLLFDLLTLDEQRTEELTAHLRFDIDLLAERLEAAISSVTKEKTTGMLGIGLFGASTGAAAALLAAARRQDVVQAVVSRGGRPDLADRALRYVHAPTLLVVGANDPVVLHLNRTALDRLPAKKHLEIVPRATHLFEEPGALEQVAHLAGRWFVEHLRDRSVGHRAA